MSGNKHARHMVLWYLAGELFGAGLLSCMYAACTICMRAGDYVRSWIHVPLFTVSEELIDIFMYVYRVFLRVVLLPCVHGAGHTCVTYIHS